MTLVIEYTLINKAPEVYPQTYRTQNRINPGNMEMIVVGKEQIQKRRLHRKYVPEERKKQTS